jgi:hypothetical protein
VARDRARRVRPEAPPARSRNEEHVQAAGVALSPHLHVPDGAVSVFDDERLDVRAPQTREHLLPSERLAVPVGRDVRIRMPRNEQVDVGLVGTSHDGRRAANLAVAATCQVSSTALRSRAGAFSQ